MNTVYITKIQTDIYEFVKQKIKENFNIDNPIILKTDKGKPYIQNEDIFFNISHSNGLKAVAIGKNEVGIDVEFLKKPNLKVVKRFTKPEQDYILETDSDNRFFEVWTKKEAYLKYKGWGLSYGLDRFNVLEMSNMFKTLTKDRCIITVCSNEEYRIEDENEIQ